MLHNLKLYENETENLTCLDEHGKLIIFKNVNDLIRYFVKFRLTYFDKRKDFLLNELSRKNIQLSNRAKFIKLIIDGKLNLRNKPKAEVVDELTKLKFERIEESYDYLLNMAIQSMTKERYEALLREIQENTDESIQISKTEPIDMYRTDLKELRKKLS
jgi:DNA topoisomerase-2